MVEVGYRDLMEKSNGRIPFDAQDEYEKILGCLRYYTRGKFRKLFGEPECSVGLSEILAWWRSTKHFHKTLTKREPRPFHA